MVIKTYLKTLWRMFEKHVTRLLSIIFMVLISVGFCSGIGMAPDKIDHSLDDYYKSSNASDFIIKSTSQSGFTAEEISAVEKLFEGAEINTGMSLDVSVGEKRSLRLYFLDFDNWTVNKPEFTGDKRVKDASECYAESADNVIKGYADGEETEVDIYGFKLKLKVAATIHGALTFSNDGEPSYNNDIAEVPETTTGTADMDCLENILYVSATAMPFLPTGDIYIAIENRNLFGCFSKPYKTYIDQKADEIKAELSQAEVLTLYDNYSYKSLSSYSDKVEAIGYVLVVVFLLVTALVVLSTMTRLLDEERSQIACLKTLGYSSTGIISKYLLFALIATGIGGVGAYFVGIGLAYFLYVVFNYSFRMPPMSSHVVLLFYVLTFILIVVATLAATAISGYKMTEDRPANLLRPKPPKAGKKVILERIPVLWNRLSFKYKSTMRNVLRYKSRFFMTVIAVAFSTALVMAGLGLVDMCLFHDFGSGAILGIASVIVVFAGLLTAVVIYTLTNINISERNREIATLMVLGYHNGEVTGYIYREVLINSFIGILVGYPLSALLLWVVFKTMGLGSVGEVSWFMWLIAPVIVMLFTGFVMLILIRKIIKVDMNESLKAIE